jgi:AcrR family transcriptional regulator
MARATITEAIINSARRQLGEVGPAALSLRAVARDIGMVSSAVYRYVASRDELLTELIIAAYDELGAAVETAEDAVAADALESRFRAMSTAVRRWALEHPHDWALLYGTPVPGYSAPERTVGPASRVVLRLLRILVDLQEQGGRASPPVDDRLHRSIAGLRAVTHGAVDDALLVRGTAAWATLVGVISLELFGHLVGGVEDYEPHFAHIVRTLADDLGIADA